MAAPPPLDPTRLLPIAARVLGRRVDEITEVTEVVAAPLSYRAFNPVSQGLYRIEGSARVGLTTTRWAVVLKICQPPSEADLARVPSAMREDFLNVLRWDREPEAYASGLLETIAPGLSAPRCLGLERRDEGIWMWLELVEDQMVSWDIERYALAARHLARFNGEYLAGRPIPDYGWLSRDWIRGWSTYFSRLARAILDEDRVWLDPRVIDLFPATARDDLRHLLIDRDRWWTALDQLARTVSHLDAFRANLLSRENSGVIETVAVDWAFVGLAPIGAEIAQLVVGSLFYHGELLDPAELTTATLRGYAQGLRDAGHSLQSDELERAYILNAIARWALTIHPLGAAGDPTRELFARTTGRPFTEVLALIAARTRYLCQLSRKVRLSA